MPLHPAARSSLRSENKAGRGSVEPDVKDQPEFYKFLPGVPALYYGDEIGLPGANDPDCRRTFPLVFSMEQKRFLAVIEPILGLRREHRSLSHGNFSVIESRNRSLIIKRQYEDCEFTVVVNAGDREQFVSTNLPTNLRSIMGEKVSGNSIPGHSLLIAGGMECTCPKR